MKSKYSRKLLVSILALIFLIFSILAIQYTYARYITALTTKSYVELGSWLININEQNIMANSNFTNAISPVLNSDSDYIADGKFVPTSTGYAQIVIDYSNVKVPFKYELTITQDDDLFIEDINITDYQINSGTFHTFDGSAITNTIIPNGTSTSQTVKFNFAWKDGTGSGEALNDAEDTKASRDFQNIKLHFNISFTQLIS